MFYRALDNIKFKTSIKQEYFERAADSLKEKRMIFSAPNSDEGIGYCNNIHVHNLRL